MPLIRSRPRTVPGPGMLVLVALIGLIPVAARAALGESRVETTTRFLEFDQPQGLLAYELTLRNVASLPVSALRLSAEPACLEGPLEVNELAKEQQASRRFTFAIEPGQQVFQPRFELEYTNYEGERLRVSPDRSPLVLGVDFAAVDLGRGQVVLRVDLLNPGTESLLFLELWAENPSLDEGELGLGDLEPGQEQRRELHFSLPVGEVFFNPTLHLSYHALQAEGSRLHRNFYTILQPRLDRVATALALPPTP